MVQPALCGKTRKTLLRTYLCTTCERMITGKCHNIIIGEFKDFYRFGRPNDRPGERLDFHYHGGRCFPKGLKKTLRLKGYVPQYRPRKRYSDEEGENEDYP